MAGTWMQTVARSFLVLHLTGSGTALGLATAARFLPVFLFGPFGGRARRPARRAAGALSDPDALGRFAVLVAAGVIEMWMVYVLAVALGCVNVFDNPARQSFISEMVPPEQVSNAVTLNSVALNMARVFGAAAGGILVAGLGLAMCFALNGVSFAAVLVSLLLMRADELYPSVRVKKERRHHEEMPPGWRSTPERRRPWSSAPPRPWLRRPPLSPGLNRLRNSVPLLPVIHVGGTGTVVVGPAGA
jgi:Transmembrane secretion effector